MSEAPQAIEIVGKGSMARWKLMFVRRQHVFDGGHFQTPEGWPEYFMTIFWRVMKNHEIFGLKQEWIYRTWGQMITAVKVSRLEDFIRP